MTRIFVSYRREDSAGYAVWLYDRLRRHFGDDNLFMDVATIAPGLDFVAAIENAVGSCDVLLAVIGRRWLTVTDSGGARRLDNPKDFVRLEIATALARDIRVIPVLVDGVHMPPATELPDALQPLAHRHAYTVSERSYPDADRLIAALETVIGGREGTSIIKAAMRWVWRTVSMPIIKLSTGYGQRSGNQKLRAGGLIVSIIVILLATIQIFIDWPWHTNNDAIESWNPKDLSGKLPSSQDIRVIVVIFKNLTQITEQISLPAEVCSQEQVSQQPLKVDRYAADARDLLEEVLTDRTDITVVSREQLSNTICEMELRRSGLMDRNTAVAVAGKQLGANIRVEGTINNIRVKKHTFKTNSVESLRTTVTARLNIRFVSIETGELLFSKTLQGEEENISTNIGRMDDNEMIAAAIKKAIDNYKNTDELKTKLTSRMQS